MDNPLTKRDGGSGIMELHGDGVLVVVCK